MSPQPFAIERKVAGSERAASLKRVIISNFKNIGVCDVELGDLTLIVGRNGAGKSNLLDAIQFVADR